MTTSTRIARICTILSIAGAATVGALGISAPEVEATTPEAAVELAPEEIVAEVIEPEAVEPEVEEEAEAPAGDPAGLSVVSLKVGTGLDRGKRRLAEAGDRFSPQSGRIVALVEVSNPGAPAEVEMVWKKEGKVWWTATLEVGTSPRWKTWSYKTPRAADVGAWTVEVRTKGGALLADAAFTIEAAEPGI